MPCAAIFYKTNVDLKTLTHKSMSKYDSSLTPPFDDSVQLSDMQVDISDDLPIVASEEGGGGVMDVPDVDVPEPNRQISKTRGYLIVGILFFINLLNYMDRFTIAGLWTLLFMI